MATVINFKISQYNYDVMRHVSELSNDGLYNIFNVEIDPTILTAALRRVSKQERLIFKYYLRKSVR